MKYGKYEGSRAHKHTEHPHTHTQIHTLINTHANEKWEEKNLCKIKKVYDVILKVCEMRFVFDNNPKFSGGKEKRLPIVSVKDG